MVGAAGFEPATPWSRTKCATKLRYAPTMFRSIARKFGFVNTFLKAHDAYPVSFLQVHTLGMIHGKHAAFSENSKIYLTTPTPFVTIFHVNAGIAQLVERRIRNA